MSATVSDKTGDHFSEVFGNKRGADRPDEDTPTAELEAGAFCASGCGNPITKPPSVEDWDGDVRVFYCDQCGGHVGGTVANLNATQQSPPSHGTPAKEARRTHRKTAIAELKETRRANKRRWHKCFLSRPFGHEWVPPDATEDWEEPPHCVGCGKRQNKPFGY